MVPSYFSVCRTNLTFNLPKKRIVRFFRDRLILSERLIHSACSSSFGFIGCQPFLWLQYLRISAYPCREAAVAIAVAFNCLTSFQILIPFSSLAIKRPAHTKSYSAPPKVAQL